MKLDWFESLKGFSVLSKCDELDDEIDLSDSMFLKSSAALVFFTDVLRFNLRAAQSSCHCDAHSSN